MFASRTSTFTVDVFPFTTVIRSSAGGPPLPDRAELGVCTFRVQGGDPERAIRARREPLHRSPERGLSLRASLNGLKDEGHHDPRQWPSLFVHDDAADLLLIQ